MVNPTTRGVSSSRAVRPGSTMRGCLGHWQCGTARYRSRCVRPERSQMRTAPRLESGRRWCTAKLAAAELAVPAAEVAADAATDASTEVTARAADVATDAADVAADAADVAADA